MQELIEQITQKTGIPADKAQDVLKVVSSFVQQRFPQLAGPLSSVLGTGGGAAGPGAGGNNDSGLGGIMGDIGGKMGF